jgi:hypothetical protein
VVRGQPATHLLPQVQVTSWSGKAGPFLMRRRHRSSAAALCVAVVLFVAGCGGSGSSDAPQPQPAAAPVPVAGLPVAVEPARPGARVEAGPGTPAEVRRALAGDSVLVVAFLMTAAADDRSVAAQIDQLRRDPAYRGGVRYFVYTVGGRPVFGDLPDRLGITGTPAVAVIARDRTLSNRWVGLVDAVMLRQAVDDASSREVVGLRP